MAAMQAGKPALETSPRMSAAASLASSDRRWAGLMAWVVGVAVIGFAVLYSPGPPSYTLTNETLRIDDRFFPITVDAEAVDVPRIRVVDITQEPAWRPTGQTDGFANPSYRSGWFRVASGGKVRMYWASSKRLVLLPPKGSGVPVLLEAREPEQMVEDLRQAWSDPL